MGDREVSSNLQPEALRGLKLLYTDVEISNAVFRIARDIMRDTPPGGDVVLIPVLVGALPFAMDLLAVLDAFEPGRTSLFPIDARSYGDEQEPHEVVLSPENRLRTALTPNTLAVIVEDIVDSGYTASKVISYVHDQHPVPTQLQLATLIAKQPNRKAIVHIDYVGFTLIEDYWVVGYGLDDKQRLRGLLCIYRKDPHASS